MGNKNSYNNANFVQVGYPHNGCNNGCDNNDVVAATSYNACNCDNGIVYNSNDCGCENKAAYNNDCGCENKAAYNNGCGCENEMVYANKNGGKQGKWDKKHGDQCCSCECDSCNAGETHVFFESCDGAKEIAITSRCQEDEDLGRMLDVNCTLLNVCPGRRSALGITLTEMDEDGTEYARGFRAITVPAHNARCNQDVAVDTVRFILPEDLSLQNRRHFIVRTQHHYLDASSIWNNGWGCKH